MKRERPIRVLVVDDSELVRRILVETLQRDAEVEVISTAGDPYEAREKIAAQAPDVVTLDIEMPRMDGLTFLEKLMRYHPLPVIIISSLGRSGSGPAIEALRLGAVEVVQKPTDPESLANLRASLGDKVRAASMARVRRLVTAPGQTARADVARRHIGPPSLFVIAIGASTGGTEAVERVLCQLPEQPAGIVIAQHIPAHFSRSWAERLNRVCPMVVKEAEDGDLVRRGLALIAPGDLHMVLTASNRCFAVGLRSGPKVCYQRPSVDVLFRSVAAVAAPRAAGILLTGMGTDGAQGMLKLREKGCFTIAQDEASCVIFGMPAAAIALGGASTVLPLDRMGSAITGASMPGA